jgi:hypothetical protein
MFDILITVAPKDYNKLPFVMESIVKNIKGYNNIHLVSNGCIPDDKIFCDATLYLDSEILDYDFSKINNAERRGWYRQQFIKLFQEITTDNYLVIDADAYINRLFTINPANPVFYLGRDQYHAPYFECFKRICGLERVYPHSFISEIMFFKRGFIKHLLFHQQCDIPTFIDRCVEAINHINNGSGFSEYEFYGNYVSRARQIVYQYQPINVMHQKKYRQWTDDEIKQYIRKYKDSNYDILTMHSWI